MTTHMYISASRLNNLVVEERGRNIYLNALDPGNDTQLWTFDPTPNPGVFYIHSKASGKVLTVPAGVQEGAFPTLSGKMASYDPTQLWKFIPSGDGAHRLIQNYSLDGNGMVLDCGGGGVGKKIFMWSRADNDNQKFYVQI